MHSGHGHKFTTTLPRAENAKWPTFSTTWKSKGVKMSSDWQLEETVAAVAQVPELAAEGEAAAANTAEEKATFVVQDDKKPSRKRASKQSAAHSATRRRTT